MVNQESETFREMCFQTNYQDISGKFRIGNLMVYIEIINENVSNKSSSPFININCNQTLDGNCKVTIRLRGKKHKQTT